MAQIHALTPEGRLPTAAQAHVGELIDATVPRITHEWAGTPHASQSIRRTAGQETGRNRIANPSFENGTGGVSSSNIIELARTNLPSRVEHGSWALWPTITEDTGSLTYVQQDAGTIPAGAEYVGARVMAFATNGTAGSARLRASFLVNGSREYEWMSVLTDVRAAQHVLHGAVQIPEGATSARLMLYLYGTGSELTAGSRFATDGWMFTTSATRTGALEAVRNYFDGDTPPMTRIDVLEQRIAELESATDPVDPEDAPEE